MYDVIVVGARCAGASTALLLGRRGHRVLLLDRGVFPSDMALSTHLVWPRGVAQLAEWGLRESLVDSGCPPLPTARMDFGELVLEGPLEPAGEVAEAYASTRPHSSWPAATVDDPTRVASAIPPAAPPGHAPVSTDEGGGRDCPRFG